MDIPPVAPLTSLELDSLDAFLQGAPGPVNSLEMLDGFFSALVVAPDLTLPSAYLPLILGEPDNRATPAFESIEEAQTTLDLLLRHWNHIAVVLMSGEPKSLILVDDDPAPEGSRWARGFLHGVRMAPWSWQQLVNDDELAAPFSAIFALAGDDDLAEHLPFPITPDLREQLLVAAALGLTHMYETSRKLAAPPTRRSGKPPRNRSRKKRRK